MYIIKTPNKLTIIDDTLRTLNIAPKKIKLSMGFGLKKIEFEWERSNIFRFRTINLV
jgi:hypothetical protein